MFWSAEKHITWQVNAFIPLYYCLSGANQGQRTRLLLKVLAISDLVIYRTHADRLHDDLFKFLGDASDAYLKHFSRELKATTARCGLDVPLSTLGPAVIIFHETVHTKLLGSGTSEEPSPSITLLFMLYKINEQDRYPLSLSLCSLSFSSLTLPPKINHLSQPSVCCRSVSGSWVCSRKRSAPSSTVELGPTTLQQTSAVCCAAWSSSWITTPPAHHALPVSSTRLCRLGGFGV